MRDDLDTYFLADDTKAQCPDQELRHLTDTQETIATRRDDIFLVREKGSKEFLGFITKADVLKYRPSTKR